MTTLRATSGRSKAFRGWLSQVSVSLGATLIATLVSQSLPSPAPDPAPRPEAVGGGHDGREVPPPAGGALGIDSSERPIRDTSIPVPVPVASRYRTRRASPDTAAPRLLVARPAHVPADVGARRGKPAPSAPMAATRPSGTEEVHPVRVAEAEDDAPPRPGSRPLDGDPSWIPTTGVVAWAATASVLGMLTPHVPR